MILAYLKDPPRTPRELHAFIKLITGHHLVDRAVEDGHTAPFAMVSDLYFEIVTHAVGLASRGTGKTYQTSVGLDLCEALFKPKCDIMHFGAIQLQAANALQHIRETLFANPIILDQVRGDPLAEKITFKNGNTIRVAPLTQKQASGPHVPKLRVDELDKVDRYNDFEQALSIPQTSGGVKASILVTSTRDEATGPMQRFLDHIKGKAGWTLYSWNFWDVLQPCVDRDCATCPAALINLGSEPGETLTACGVDPSTGDLVGRAKRLPTGGWMPVQDMINALDSMSSEKFVISWLNEMPGAEFLIFCRPPFWDDARNLVEAVDPPADAVRWRCVDWGHTVWHYYFEHGGKAYWYDRIDFGETSTQDQAEMIKAHEHRSSWHKVKDRRGNVRPAKFAGGYADPAGKDAINNLRGGGISLMKANNDFDDGVDTVRHALQHRKLLAHRRPSVLEGLEHLKRYAWLKGADGKPRIGFPDKGSGHDHDGDVLRYFLHSRKTKSGRITGRQI